MRILLTTDAVGGVLTYSRELVRALAGDGFEFCVAVLGPVAEGAVLPRRYEHHAGKLEWMEEPWADVASATEWVEGLLGRYQPDVVHVNTYMALRTETPVVLGAHSCVLSWWQAVKGEAAPERYDMYRRHVERALRGADRIVTPSAAMGAALAAEYGELPQVQVIANGRGAGAFVPRPKRPVIVTAGRLWDEAKNLRAVAAVAPELAWPVFAAGEGNPERVDNLRLLGRLSEADMAAWLGSAAIYALPALYEPFGLSVLEAALCGCALVLGDIPSLRELWDGAAVFVNPRDHDGLRAALQQLIADDDRRAALQGMARARAKQYGSARLAASYREMYRDVVEKSQRRMLCAS